jgi:Carboxypeptidase regulatory-like domain
MRYPFSSRNAALAAVFFALLAGPVQAQNIGKTTGSIRGVIKDDTGGVLPGVTVTASSPSLVGVRTAVTGADGAYDFPGLAIGPYRIQATLTGFAPSLVQGLDLRAGQTLKADLVLKAGLTETVTVEGSSIIDVVSVEQQNNISAETFNTLPKGRSWESIVELAPSVNTEDLNRTRGLSFQGASVHENVYIVDGVDATETTSASQGQDVVFEFLENIQVKSGFLGAEYGGALGGVVNMQTKSGSNEFRGGLNFQYSGSRLAGDPRQRLRIAPTNTLLSEYIQDPEDESRVLDFGGFLGGPIRKDKLWFFAGVMPQNTDTSRTVNYPATSTLPAQSVTVDSTGRRPFASAKLTWRAASDLTVNLSYQFAPRKDVGRLPSFDLTDDRASDFKSLGVERNRSTYALNADWVASPTVFVNAFAGYYTQRGGSLGVPVGDRFRCVTSNLSIAGVPADLQCAAGYQTLLDNNPTLREENDRLSLGASANFNFKAAGNHSLKVGIQYATPKSTTENLLTGERVDLHWGLSQIGIRGQYGYWRNITISNKGAAKSRNAAAFIQDQWTKDRVTFNLGLRLENEHNIPLTSATDTVDRDIVFSWSEKVAPRLGVAWDVKGDSSWRVYANAGYFYDTLKQTATQLLFGSRLFRFDYYRLDTLNWRSLGKAAAAAAGAPFFVLDFSGSPVYVPPDTRPTRTDEFALGSDYQLGRNWAVSMQYSHRALQNAVEDFNVTPITVDGQRYTTLIGNPGRGILKQPFAGQPVLPDFERTYDGVTIELTRRMANRWALNGSYTLSRLYGNYEGLGDSDEQVLGGGTPNAGRYCTTLESCYNGKGEVDKGPLTLDRPHQFKLNGSYALNAGLTVGAFFRASSGTVITPQLGVNQAPITHPEGRGSRGRTPFFTQTDIFLQYGVKVGKEMRVTASANVTNVFDQDTTRGVFPGILLGSAATTPVPAATYFAPGGYNYEAVIAAVPAANKDPRFLKPQLYQAPRALRLGLTLDF